MDLQSLILLPLIPAFLSQRSFAQLLMTMKTTKTTESPAVLHREEFRVIVVDEQGEWFDRYLACVEGCLCNETERTDSLRGALTRIEGAPDFGGSEPAFIILVVALDILAAEPGNLQYKVSMLSDRGRLAVVGGLAPGRDVPQFIHPIIPRDIVQYPYVASQLALRIQFLVAHWQSLRTSQWYQSVLSLIGDAVIAVDARGYAVWANRQAAALLGYSPENLPGLDLRNTCETLIQRIQTVGPGQVVRIAAMQVNRIHSEPITIECVVQRSNDPSLNAVVVFRDVTVERKREAELKLSAKVFESSGEAIMITDREDRILSVNSAFTSVTGYSAHEVIGRTPRFLSAGKLGSDFYEQMWRTVHQNGHWKGEVWNRRKDGEVYAEWLAVSAVRNEGDDIDHYVSIFSDITERKMRDEHIEHQAQHDFLTGLPNRILLEDRFNRIIAHAQRHPQHVAVLFIDLDGFKKINDTLGHRIGDTLLCSVAQRLGGSVRSSDTVSRHGGDEFVCLLAELSGVDDAIKITETILHALQQPVVTEAHSLEVTASVGLSIYPEHGMHLDELMSRADAAMYEAKRRGRNRYAIYHD